MIFNEESKRVYNIIISLLLLCIGLSAIVLNAALLYVATRNQQRRSPIRPLIINLCVCDLFISVFVLPFTFWSSMVTSIPLGNAACKTVHFSENIVVFASVFTLTSISFERGVGVKRILSPRQTWEEHGAPTPRCWKALTLIWILSAFFALPNAINFHTIEFPGFFNGTSEEICQKNWNTIILLFKDEASTHHNFLAELLHTVVVMLVLFIIPATVIITAYARIYFFVKQCNKFFINAELSDSNPFLECERRDSNAARLSRSNRLFKVSVILVLVFVVFWLPLHLFNLSFDVYYHLRNTFDPPNGTDVFLKDLYMFLLSLALANSAANPFFLFATDRSYRHQIWMFLPRCCR